MMTTNQSASLAVHGEVKRGSHTTEPKAPLTCGGEAPTARSEFFTLAARTTVAGVGIDLLRLDRIERAYARRGERFVRRILGAEEIAVFERRSARAPARGLRYLATRFAAKEAFSKAIGLGMRSPMDWRRMQTLNSASGQPRVVLAEPLASWYAERFGAAHVSITDESDLVAAFVVVESHPARTA